MRSKVLNLQFEEPKEEEEHEVAVEEEEPEKAPELAQQERKGEVMAEDVIPEAERSRRRNLSRSQQRWEIFQ